MRLPPFGQLARYAVQGVVSAGVYFLSGYGLHALGAPVAVMGTVSFAAAVATNYVLQKQWVFEDARPVRASLPRFAAAAGIGFLVNMVVLWTLAPVAPIGLAEAAAGVAVVVSNAVLAFTWVFVAGRPRV